VFWSPSKCRVEAVSHVGFAWALIRRGTLFLATHARGHAINFLPKFGSLYFWESFHVIFFPSGYVYLPHYVYSGVDWIEIPDPTLT